MSFRHALFFLALPGWATTLIQTTLSDPNQVFTSTLTVIAPSYISVQTWSYGGGTSATGPVIPDGGFDPIVSLFSGTGPAATLLTFNDDGTCPPGNNDPNTFACLDSTLDVGVNPGDYTLAFTAYANFANGPTLGDGFSDRGSFTDIFGSDRTGNLAADLDVTPAPEPATGPILLLGALALWKYRRRLEPQRKQ